MSSRGVGGMGAGCAGFSLIGLLLGVGLTLWLGAQVLDATGPTSASRPPPTTARTNPTVTIEPATGLANGSTVTVTATGLTPGSVGVTPCVMATEVAPRCDETKTVAAVADADGLASTAFTVTQTITVDDAPVDCALASCALVVHPSDRLEGPSTLLLFETG